MVVGFRGGGGACLSCLWSHLDESRVFRWIYAGRRMPMSGGVDVSASSVHDNSSTPSFVGGKRNPNFSQRASVLL